MGGKVNMLQVMLALIQDRLCLTSRLTRESAYGQMYPVMKSLNPRFDAPVDVVREQRRFVSTVATQVTFLKNAQRRQRLMFVHHCLILNRLDWSCSFSQPYRNVVVSLSILSFGKVRFDSNSVLRTIICRFVFHSQLVVDFHKHVNISVAHILCMLPVQWCC